MYFPSDSWNKFSPNKPSKTPFKLPNSLSPLDPENDSQTAEAIFRASTRQLFQEKRKEEIDKALDERNEARFLALTSNGWEALIFNQLTLKP